MARKKTTPPSKAPIEVDIDVLSEDFGIPTWEGVLDNLERGEAWSYAFRGALKEAKDDGLDDEEADAVARGKADDYEWELSQAYYKAWNASRLEALEETLEQKNDKWFIAPKKSWKDSAAHIVEVINGVGYFHFGSVDDLLASGPYTLREAILGHIHHLLHYGSVYGTYSTRQIFDRALNIKARHL